MKIVTVESPRDLKRFVTAAWNIYRDDPYWVPPLIADTCDLFNSRKNLFWEHAERRVFMALDDRGAVLGRVAAVIDHNFIRFHGEKTGFFAFFESVNDPSVSGALLSAAELWLRDRGMEKVIGPTAPSTNDEMGMLIEGYDGRPVLMMPYNPPYYHDLVRAYGFSKAKDLLAYHVDSRNLPISRLEKLAAGVLRRNPGLTVRPVSLQHLDRELRYAVRIYNNAWEKNWGFVPWTEQEFVAQAMRLKPLLEPKLVQFAFLGDEPVGMIIAVPDYNEVLARLNGRLGPVELVKFLYYKRKIRLARIMIMGTVHALRGQGIEALLYLSVIENGMALGYHEGEFSWILEDNIMMCRAAEMLGGTPYRRYRVYGKRIA